jgi:hypothetical protein
MQQAGRLWRCTKASVPGHTCIARRCVSSSASGGGPGSGGRGGPGSSIPGVALGAPPSTSAAAVVQAPSWRAGSGSPARFDPSAGIFYRRPLPSNCIDFSSPQGKELFGQAQAAGHMACFFILAAQFRTQDEPAFCGLSTLVMVLNSLCIDPGRTVRDG